MNRVRDEGEVRDDERREREVRKEWGEGKGGCW